MEPDSDWEPLTDDDSVLVIEREAVSVAELVKLDDGVAEGVIVLDTLASGLCVLDGEPLRDSVAVVAAADGVTDGLRDMLSVAVPLTLGVQEPVIVLEYVLGGVGYGEYAGGRPNALAPTPNSSSEYDQLAPSCVALMRKECAVGNAHPTVLLGLAYTTK